MQKICRTALPKFNEPSRTASTHLFAFQVSSIHSRSFSNGGKHLRVVLVGPPGSGKGTQAAKLQRDFGVIPISTGHLLRTEVSTGSEQGKQIDQIIKNGGLVSDEIVLDLIKNTLQQKDVLEKGWVLDGYPRTKNQSEQLKSLVASVAQPLNVVFYLNITEDAIFERVKDRWVHLPSGRDYNTIYKPPKVPGRDDVTGEPLVKRQDDNLETIRARLKSYKESTLPILKTFENEGLLHNVDSPTSDIGYVHILNRLKQIGFNAKPPAQ